MSKWWRKVQEVLPKPSSLKKTASKNVSFMQKYDIGKRSAQLRQQARERAEEAASRLAGSARVLPSKAAEVRKRLERGREEVSITYPTRAETHTRQHATFW